MNLSSLSLNLSKLIFLMSWCIKSKLSAKLLRLFPHWPSLSSQIFLAILSLHSPLERPIPCPWTILTRLCSLSHHSCCFLCLKHTNVLRLLPTQPQSCVHMPCQCYEHFPDCSLSQCHVGTYTWLPVIISQFSLHLNNDFCCTTLFHVK